MVVLNASIELAYYTGMLDKSRQSQRPIAAAPSSPPESMTRDGKLVIAHNNWSGYLEGSRWNIMFDIRPGKGTAS